MIFLKRVSLLADQLFKMLSNLIIFSIKLASSCLSTDVESQTPKAYKDRYKDLENDDCELSRIKVVIGILRYFAFSIKNFNTAYFWIIPYCIC